MSWQAYVDTNLVGTGHIEKAAIVGLDGNVWAKSAALDVKPGEGAKIANGFKDPASVNASGITIGATKYLCIKSDARSAYGKKGPAGVVCVKTKQCVLIGIYGEKTQPGNATNVVEKLADYLIENGY